MNVSVNFPAKIEAALLRSAAAAGRDVATFVRDVVAERLAEDTALPRRAMSHDEFMAKLREIIDLHRPSNGSLDDSRESIYDGGDYDSHGQE